MIDYKNRYETRSYVSGISQTKQHMIYDKRLDELVWLSKSQKENESLCKNLNNGSGFQGEIPKFFKGLQ